MEEQLISRTKHVQQRLSDTEVKLTDPPPPMVTMRVLKGEVIKHVNQVLYPTNKELSI